MLTVGLPCAVLGVVLRPSHRLGARNQQLKAGKVAPLDRQVGNGSLVKDGPHVRAIGLQLGCRGSNGDAFGGAADIEFQVDLG